MSLILLWGVFCGKINFCQGFSLDKNATKCVLEMMWAWLYRKYAKISSTVVGSVYYIFVDPISLLSILLHMKLSLRIFVCASSKLLIV